MVKIYAVGGYSEVGKNMTVVETEEDAFIFDEGFYLPAIVEMQEKDRDEFSHSKAKMQRAGAIPDDNSIDKIKHKIRAQFIGHAHLDHVGAVPFMSDKYDAPIYGTPFTISLLIALLKDEDIFLKNKLKSVQPNTSFYVKGKSKSYLVEFINVTHSTVQTTLIALHTEKGVILYCNDFKLDDTPIVGAKPNYKRLQELSKEGILAVILDSLYAGTDRKTPSEKIARSLLEETMLKLDHQHNGMLVTTFSSHIARLKSIVEFGKKLDREIVFLGRSLGKYSYAAKDVNLAPFLQDVRIMRYRRQVEKTLKNVERNKGKYLVVCTGHQGEPGSILERISKNNLHLKLNQDYNILFSSSVIPTEINKIQFAEMEKRLKKKKARLFRDLHVSGHGGREDLREFLKLTNPQHVIPSHGAFDKTQPAEDLAVEMGWKHGKTCHLMKNKDVLEL